MPCNPLDKIKINKLMKKSLPSFNYLLKESKSFNNFENVNPQKMNSE